MQDTELREAIRWKLKRCAKMGVNPRRPKPEWLWEAAGEDGPLALLLMLEFDLAVREYRQERARALNRERELRIRAA